MNKNDVVTEKDVEEYYQSTRKYKFLNKKKYTKIEKIFYDLCVQKESTIFIKAETTQCLSNKYRSINDFIRVVKHYLPDITVKECIKFIHYKHYLKDKSTLYFRYCPDVKKWNFGPSFTHSFGADRNRFKNLGRFKGQGFKNCKVKFADML